jgi:hypothetical protein|nr:MAG TPA: hypothetical protein [Caudoviricetes sp.]
MELLHNIIDILYNIITFIYFVFFCYCVYLKIAKKDIIKPLKAINYRKKLSLWIGLFLCLALAFAEAWSRGALK